MHVRCLQIIRLYSSGEEYRMRSRILHHMCFISPLWSSFASTLFQQFIASDRASENLANLKRVHGLMPYFMLRTALKISNPVSMIRSVLDLFMAQPFGGRSLLQR